MLIFFPTHAKRSTHLSQSKPLGLCPSFEMWFFVLLFSHLHILQACRVLACWVQMSVVSLKKKKKVLYVQKSTRKHDFQERQDCHTDILIRHHYLAAGMHSQTITTKRKLLLKWVAAVVASEQQKASVPFRGFVFWGIYSQSCPLCSAYIILCSDKNYSARVV